MQAVALDVGFQGLVETEASDNVQGANAPAEEEGIIHSGVLGIYGEHRSRSVTAAFSGELDNRKTSSADDSDFSSISRFLGAAEFKLTPRSWVWYVGDILGGVRTDDAIQPIDDAEIERRNVFVTGPIFEYEQIGQSRTSARGLYVNQTQNRESLENLYIADLSHERILSVVSYFGIRLGNIFTDLPDDSENAPEALQLEENFNRATLGIYYNRSIGFLNLFGDFGFTRYDAGDESLDGLSAELRAIQTLGPQTLLTVYVQTDLSDQSLSAVESLVQSGETAVGIAPNASGFFSETRVGVEYSFRSLDRVVSLGAGFAELDYQLLFGGLEGDIDIDGEDRQQGFATAFWSQSLTSQLRSELALNYEAQDFNNRIDNSDSLLLRFQLIYQLTRSFELQVGITHDTASGVRTRFFDTGATEEDIDITENRLSIGLRWAPPSRAGQDLTVELKSLLQ
ncbi:MAG: hypothetical protein AB8B87_05860 [Granulosicoccus sp.]